jgi:hypothetical protein
MFEKIKYYYDNGLWDIDRMFNVVGLAITETEYFEITGFEYPNKGE